MKELDRLSPFSLNYDVNTRKYYLLCDGMRKTLEVPITNEDQCFQLPGTHFVNTAYFGLSSGIEKSRYIQHLDPLFEQLREGSRPVLLLERPSKMYNEYRAREAYDRVCQFIEDEAAMLKANGYVTMVIEPAADEDPYNHLGGLHSSKQFKNEPTLIVAKEGKLSDWVSVDQFKACCELLGLHEKTPERPRILRPNFKARYAEFFNLSLLEFAKAVHFGSPDFEKIFREGEYCLFILYLNGILPACWPTLLDDDHLNYF